MYLGAERSWQRTLNAKTQTEVGPCATNVCQEQVEGAAGA